MATNDIGVRVKLEGEAQYREQMRQITQQTKLMRTESTALENSWGKGTTAMQKAAQQGDLLRSQIAKQTTILNTANANVERYSAELGVNASETLKWKNVQAQAEAELQRLQAELAAVPNRLQAYGQQLQSVGTKMQTVGKSISTVGTTLTKTITVPLAALAGVAVKTTATFDTSMSKVKALSGATADEFETLRNKAREMGSTTKYSASEAADALSYMALAGWDTTQMTEGLDGVLNLAAASGMELADASDLVTDYLTAFGLEAKDSARMADELAYAQAHSNTTTTQLGEAFGNSAAQMHTAGQSMETTTAILEAFANQGMKGSEAGTALSAMMRDITQKMKDGKIYIGNTAVAVQDANGNFRDMTDILADVEAATDGMGSAEKSAALMTTFTARSVKGVSMALTEGTDNIKQYRSELQTASGAAADMAETMQDNLAGDLTKLKSAAQELAISFGDILVPKIRTAVEWVQKQVDKFNQMDDSTKNAIVKFGLLAAAIGPVVTVVGKTVETTGKLITNLGKAVEWVGTFVKSHTALVGAAGPAALAIGAVAAAAIVLKGGLDYIEQSAREANSEMYETTDALTSMTGKMKDAGNDIKTAMDDAETSIGAVEAASKRADKAVDTIESLGKVGRLTSSEMSTMKGAVAELNGLFPDLGLEVDSTTGKLNMSTSEIRSFIAESTKMAKVTAYQKAISAMADEIADAYVAQAEAAYNMSKAEEQAEAAQKAQAEAAAAAQRDLEGLSDEERELAEVAIQAAQGNDVNAIALKDSQQAAADAQTEYDNLQGTIDEATDKSDYYQQALDELCEELGISSDALDTTSEAAEGYSEAVLDAAEDTESAADEMAEAWQKSYDSAYDSITKQTDLFGEMKEETQVDIKDMIKNLESHNNSIKNWNKNVNRLTSDTRYTSNANFKSMVDYLIQNTDAADGQLQAFVDAVDAGGADLDTALALWAEYINSTSGTFATDMANIENSVSTGMAGATAAIKNSGMPGAANETMIQTRNRIKAENLGIPAKQAVATISQAGGEATSQGKGLGDKFSGGVTAKDYSAVNAARGIANSAVNALNRGASAYYWGQHLGQQFASGITSKAGSVSVAARGLANKAARYLHFTHPDEGPLKEGTEVWGAELAQNFATGMLSGVSAISSAANRMASAVSIPSTETPDFNGLVNGVARVSSGDDITINVYASEGMNVNELADQIQARLALVQRQRVAAYA